MSKKSRRRNQMLAAGLAVIGASKLGMLGGKTASGIAGDKMASARKLMTSDTAMKGSIPDRNRGMKSIGTSSSVRTVEPKGNPKSIYVMDDGSIQKGDKLYKDKKSFANRDKTKGSSGLKDFANKFILGPKAQLNKGGNVQGKMIKARGGGMARTKPTKMY